MYTSLSSPTTAAALGYRWIDPKSASSSSSTVLRSFGQALSSLVQPRNPRRSSNQQQQQSLAAWNRVSKALSSRKARSEFDGGDSDDDNSNNTAADTKLIQNWWLSCNADQQTKHRRDRDDKAETETARIRDGAPRRRRVRLSAKRRKQLATKTTTAAGRNKRKKAKSNVSPTVRCRKKTKRKFVSLSRRATKLVARLPCLEHDLLPLARRFFDEDMFRKSSLSTSSSDGVRQLLMAGAKMDNLLLGAKVSVNASLFSSSSAAAVELEGFVVEHVREVERGRRLSILIPRRNREKQQSPPLVLVLHARQRRRRDRATNEHATATATATAAAVKVTSSYVLARYDESKVRFAVAGSWVRISEGLVF